MLFGEGMVQYTHSPANQRHQLIVNICELMYAEEGKCLHMSATWAAVAMDGFTSWRKHVLVHAFCGWELFMLEEN